MTPDELKKLDDAISIFVPECEIDKRVIEAARTLSQLMHGTHPDLVVVPHDILEQSKKNFERQYGASPTVNWYYSDLKDMITASRKDEK